MSKHNKRRLWWLWAIWGVAFLLLEGYALATKERVVPTLSRVFWWLIDKWKWVASIIIAILVWLLFHLPWGECALNLC